MLLIILKSRSGDAVVGLMLELLMCDVGVAAVNTEHSEKELNCSAFLNPVHHSRLFRCVNDMAFAGHCGSTV